MRKKSEKREMRKSTEKIQKENEGGMSQKGIRKREVRGNEKR